MTAVFDAVAARRSLSKVTDDAPDHAQLVRLVSAAARVADHSGLEPWRLIELRGAARERLGAAFAESAAARGEDAAKAARKPLRAPLLVAIVVAERDSEKVAGWEQEAVASGVAHVLSLLLDEAGWGVMWRSGHHTRSAAVARVHGLAANERLLGWLYVGGAPMPGKPRSAKRVDGERFLSALP